MSHWYVLGAFRTGFCLRVLTSSCSTLHDKEGKQNSWVQGLGAVKRKHTTAKRSDFFFSTLFAPFLQSYINVLFRRFSHQTLLTVASNVFFFLFLEAVISFMMKAYLVNGFFFANLFKSATKESIYL